MPYQTLIQRFQSSSEDRKKYRDAIEVLERIGIDGILHEAARLLEADVSDPNCIQMSALLHARAVGYSECIEALFKLEELGAEPKIDAPRDYGAFEDLLGEYSEDQINQLRESLND